MCVRDIVRDCQHPFLHLLQGDKLRANKRPCLLNEFIQSVCVLSCLCFDAHTPWQMMSIWLQTLKDLSLLRK